MAADQRSACNVALYLDLINHSKLTRKFVMLSSKSMQSRHDDIGIPNFPLQSNMHTTASWHGQLIRTRLFFTAFRRPRKIQANLKVQQKNKFTIIIIMCMSFLHVQKAKEFSGDIRIFTSLRMGCHSKCLMMPQTRSSRRTNLPTALRVIIFASPSSSQIRQRAWHFHQ